MNGSLLSLFQECGRIFFLAIIPFIGSALIAGTASLFLQLITDVREPVFSYVFRLVALVVCGVLTFQSLAQVFMDFLQSGLAPF